MASTGEYVFSVGDILGSVPSTKKNETKIQNKQKKCFNYLNIKPSDQKHFSLQTV